MVRNYRQENGTYLFPMELAGRKCQEDRTARAADILKAKLDGFSVDYVKFGYRIFEAVLIPVTEERFKDLVRDEDNRQKVVRIEGKCPISNGNGGIICTLPSIIEDVPYTGQAMHFTPDYSYSEVYEFIYYVVLLIYRK